MAGAFALLTMNVTSDIALVNSTKVKAIGEMMDLQHGQSFFGRRIHICGDSDYAISAGSKVCVITAGARQKEGESRLDLVQTNVEIFKGIVPNIVKYSPNCIIVVVSNPVDIMSWVTWKLSGLPRHRIIGSGTSLDTSRFRYLLGKKFGIGGQSIHAYILGEHGDSSVAIWSGINIGGTMLTDINPHAGDETGKDPENWHEIHQEVIDAAYKIIELKGYTSWGIGLMICRLCECILKNQRSVVTVSTAPEGWQGIHEECFISMPAVVGEFGITHVVNTRLSAAEKQKLLDSVEVMVKVIGDISLD